MDEISVTGFIRERLSKVFDIEKMVIFGSRARGDAKPDSDWDVLVITDSDIPFIKRQSFALRQIGQRNFSLDLLVYTPQEASEASSLLGSALYWAEKEGRVVFAK